MPKVTVNGITMNYEQQGSGEPIVLVPYLTADNACYAFQTAEYAKHFTCISLDPRGAGESDKTAGPCTTEQYADDVAGFMSAIDVEKAHIFGLSLGAATGMWLAAKYPAKVKTLSLHSGWTKSDPFLKTVVESWRVAAKALGSVPEMVITTIFPWCLTPELYAARPDYIQALADFVRSRPGQLVGRRCRAISENGPQQGGERGRRHERGSRACSSTMIPDADLKAIAVYLKDQNGAASAPPQALAASDPVMKAGSAIYRDQCSACHKLDGAGVTEMFPALRAAPSVRAEDPTSLIRVAMNGTRTAATEAAPTGPGMPSYAWQLDDRQMAAILTFVRNAWGNAAPAVPESAVQSARASLAGAE